MTTVTLSSEARYRSYTLVWCGNCKQHYDKDANPKKCPKCGYTGN